MMRQGEPALAIDSVPAGRDRGAVSAAAALLGDQMTARRLRLAGGLVMLTYLAGHLVMHSLGNISLEAMERGTRVHDFVWHSGIGTVTLYGAFAVHFALALWALYARDSLRMGAGEWTRLLLGFTILPLLIHHFAAGRYVYSAFDVQRTYDVVLTVYFKFMPFWGWRQVTVLLVAWVHGCLGVHFWLRPRPHYRRFLPLLLAVGTLLPVLALLGIWQGTREVLALAANPEWLGAVAGKGAVRNPEVATATATLKVQLHWTYALLVGGALAARALRGFLERRRGLISIAYPNGQSVRVPRGWAVLDASRRGRIPHAAICGGRGRCTTCRVRVLRGFEDLAHPEPSEQAALERLRAGPTVRSPASFVRSVTSRCCRSCLPAWWMTGGVSAGAPSATTNASSRSSSSTSAARPPWSNRAHLTTWSSSSTISSKLSPARSSRRAVCPTSFSATA